MYDRYILVCNRLNLPALPKPDIPATDMRSQEPGFGWATLPFAPKTFAQLPSAQTLPFMLTEFSDSTTINPRNGDQLTQCKRRKTNALQEQSSRKQVVSCVPLPTSAGSLQQSMQDSHEYFASASCVPANPPQRSSMDPTTSVSRRISPAPIIPPHDFSETASSSGNSLVSCPLLHTNNIIVFNTDRTHYGSYKNTKRGGGWIYDTVALNS